ncbi:putative Late nodulin [Medicago truncatula]|uniref:Nodule Cysteine-Rich (NCR) secreted peptide n=1 Tax=Medicago truncatula TaxID=3880 RepID=G7INE8_MEDTR|nr:Nodule Cysteine-Rich (NCR) secreted peptide [Medicago truncatula]AFK42666.1 unknown [Medicago truncatula]RHN73300.1 putative Late nodulin [Medicago truncatula]
MKRRRNMSYILKSLYDMIFFISLLFFVVENVSATYGFYCDDDVPCNPHLCLPPLQVICGGDFLCFCIYQ